MANILCAHCTCPRWWRGFTPPPPCPVHPKEGE
jgi:hypothetical protein